MADIDKDIEKIDRGDNAWEETDEVVNIETRKPLDKVIPVRLPADKWEQIREEARELGIGPSTLSRMWILERLRQKVKTPLSGAARSDK
ncbi:MAG: hypothetical protein WC370_07335 [Dehalococcoidales bacterium]|jgi:hypothetical protein